MSPRYALHAASSLASPQAPAWSLLNAGTFAETPAIHDDPDAARLPIRFYRVQTP